MEVESYLIVNRVLQNVFGVQKKVAKLSQIRQIYLDPNLFGIPRFSSTLLFLPVKIRGCFLSKEHTPILSRHRTQ